MLNSVLSSFEFKNPGLILLANTICIAIVQRELQVTKLSQVDWKEDLSLTVWRKDFLHWMWAYSGAI